MTIPGLTAMGVGAVVAAGSGSGGGGGSVSITDQTLNAFGSGTQTITYLASNTGIIQRGRNGVYNTLETWNLSGAAADYDIRVTETGGSGLTGGSATATWLNLGTTREWELAESMSGAAATAEFTVEIRIAVAPNTVLDTAAIVMNAIVF